MRPCPGFSAWRVEVSLVAVGPAHRGNLLALIIQRQFGPVQFGPVQFGPVQFGAYTPVFITFLRQALNRAPKLYRGPQQSAEMRLNYLVLLSMHLKLR